ncbi:Uncharacterised protein [uncultured archaeon]|nr:Uncharacterised protein [uncultured archaeon]
MNWGAIILVLALLGGGYYVFTNPSVVSNISQTLQQVSSSQPAVNIPDLLANPANYTNRTIYIRGNLTQYYNFAPFSQSPTGYRIGQYFANNQSQYYLFVALPNQTHRVWKFGSTYLFSGHLVVVGPYETYGYAGSKPPADIIGSCTNESTGSNPNDLKYYCQVNTHKIIVQYFNATNATLND